MRNQVDPTVLPEQVLGALISLCQQHGVRDMALFGSAAGEGFNPETSDIDILIEFDPASVTYRKYLDLETYLQSLFPRKIEIVTTDGISPYILPYISREVVWV